MVLTDYIPNPENTNDSIITQCQEAYALFDDRAVEDYILQFIVNNNLDFKFEELHFDDVYSAIVWKYDSNVYAHPLTHTASEYFLSILSLVSVSAFYTSDIKVLPLDSLTYTQKDYLKNIGVLNKVLLSENPDDLLTDDSSARFSTASWFEEMQKTEVLLAGLGGIGSYVAYLLARTKVKSMVLYDDDVVDMSNLGGQLYTQQQTDTPKVEATVRNCRNFSCYYDFITYKKRYDSTSLVLPIMICGFDNMSARRTFFENWKLYVDSQNAEKQKQCLFIDGRLAAETFQVFCIRGDDVYNQTNYIENYWFPDEEADATICSYKQTSYMANMIGSVMVNLLVNHVSNKVVEDMRSLPFLTTYNGATMMLKTIS